MNALGKKEKAINALEKLISKKDAPVDVRAMANELMKLVGGAKGFAAIVKAEYDASKPGGMARARFLEIYMNLFKATSPKGFATDLGCYSEEELTALFKEKLEETGVVHGKEEAPTTH